MTNHPCDNLDHVAASPSPSPAESYTASRQRASYPKLTEFTSVLSFTLDPFQQQACAALEDGHGVLVCAPTGAGKTVVGEFAVHLALEQGQKCFYTTPIKALSNQKYADLVERYGTDHVGLLTGDTSINGNASDRRHDHRGPPQHALRGLDSRSTASATW